MDSFAQNLSIREAAVFLLAVYEVITMKYSSTRPVDADVIHNTVCDCLVVLCLFSSTAVASKTQPSSLGSESFLPSYATSCTMPPHQPTGW